MPGPKNHLPPDPGRLQDAPKLDPEAVKNAEISAESAQRGKFGAAEEARLARLAEDRKKENDAVFRARRADEEAFQKQTAVGEVRFDQGKKAEQVQIIEKQNAEIKSVDVNRNGVSDRAERDAAVPAKAVRLIGGMAALYLGSEHLQRVAPGARPESLLGPGPASEFANTAKSRGPVIAFTDKARLANGQPLPKPGPTASTPVSKPELQLAAQPDGEAKTAVRRPRPAAKFLPDLTPKPPSFARNKKSDGA